MKSNIKKTGKRWAIRISIFAVLVTAVSAILWQPFGSSEAAVNDDPISRMYKRPAPNFDLNKWLDLPAVRTATGEQVAALSKPKDGSERTGYDGPLECIRRLAGRYV